MGIQRPSIKDVARQSGTSISTVSNVLNDRRYVSAELRDRVLKSVRELGYSANPIAQNLKSSRTNTVGVIVTDINRIFFPPMLKGIQNVLSRAGLRITICDTRDDAERELDAIRMMKSNWVDGLILDSVADGVFPDFFQNLARPDEDGRFMPIVSVERDLTQIGIDSVYVDNVQSSHELVTHLTGLGCRRIAHIAGPENSGVAAERRTGYQRALADAKINFDPALVFQGDFTPVSGYHQTRKLITDSTPFDAIFAANDQMAVGALRALSVADISVPDRVRVVGFDNTFAASIVSPALTTIHVSSYDMGTRAAGQLLSRMEDPPRPAAGIVLPYEIIVRTSTVASAHTDWDMTFW